MKFKHFLISMIICFSDPIFAEELWSYKGLGSPEKWGDLNPDWVTCKTGKNQSPIDINETIKGNLPKLEMVFTTEVKNIINNGHTIQINTTSHMGVEIDGESFTIEQLHFHTPSENLLNGTSYPIEIHFVHSNKQGQLAVIAVMANEGKTNPIINKLLELTPKEINSTYYIERNMTLKDLFPNDMHYYRYSGSLTTPPCSEGVIWIVMKQPIEISKSQIQAFVTSLKGQNNRPLQPLNGRQIVEL